MRRLVIVSVALVVAAMAFAAQGPTGALGAQRERTASIPTGNTPLISDADALKPVPRPLARRSILGGNRGGKNPTLSRPWRALRRVRNA